MWNISLGHMAMRGGGSCYGGSHGYEGGKDHKAMEGHDMGSHGYRG